MGFHPTITQREVQPMITAFVQFSLPQPITRDKALEVFSSTAPRYRDVDGLVRKYYLLSQDGKTAGGVYLWNSREQAEQLYSEEWKKFIREKYGTEPSIAYFETPVVVDNVIGDILKDEEER
ncbi:MAG: YdhR family protein [Pseudomonadota bacterium]